MGEDYFNVYISTFVKEEQLWIVWEGGKLGTRTDSSFQIHSTDVRIPVKDQNICLV